MSKTIDDREVLVHTITQTETVIRDLSRVKSRLCSRAGLRGSDYTERYDWVIHTLSALRLALADHINSITNEAVIGDGDDDDQG